ncbi:LysR family transcriptional regulator [Actinoplanes sp. NPDC051513]|uniref:LysR family transcriptional regulator n=1 Tax=Actinoplanes sp. NPDC051513 TaxID=3363908 RepID=UPI0037B396DB
MTPSLREAGRADTATKRQSWRCWGRRRGTSTTVIARRHLPGIRLTRSCHHSLIEPPGSAAAALGLAQPALTNQFQRIERILGGALFTRDRRGVLPTPLGDPVLAAPRC